MLLIRKIIKKIYLKNLKFLGMIKKILKCQSKNLLFTFLPEVTRLQVMNIN